MIRHCPNGGSGNHGRRPSCYECGSMDHLKNVCPRLNRAPNNGAGNQRASASSRVHVIGADEAVQNPKVVSGTFLLNGHYVSLLFDSGADRSFISLEFRPLLSQKARRGLEGGETLVVQGDKSGRDLKIVSAVKFPRFLETDCDAFLAHVMDKGTKDEKLYAKFLKCQFWLQEVHFLGHVVNKDGIRIDPKKIKVVKNLEAPGSPMEISHFLGLA
ncbi:putative reverse transcriptase domain-containing protein, partial [Tanacetum coccineum]